MRTLQRCAKGTGLQATCPLLILLEGRRGWLATARVQRGPSEAARCASTASQPGSLPSRSASTEARPRRPLFLFPLHGVLEDTLRAGVVEVLSVADEPFQHRHLAPGAEPVRNLILRGTV